MKTKLIALVLTVFCAMLVGCSESPKDVAVKYMTALQDGNLEQANKYSAKGVVEKGGNEMLIALLKSEKARVAKLSDDKKKKAEENFNKAIAEIKEAQVKIEGDTAKLFKKDDKEQKNPVVLKKEDGKWVVSSIK